VSQNNWVIARVQVEQTKLKSVCNFCSS